ncbi:MAG: SDR family NAD(P)-dependent oxidoreductase, partial [Burkholderiales bacterium]
MRTRKIALATAAELSIASSLAVDAGAELWHSPVDARDMQRAGSRDRRRLGLVYGAPRQNSLEKRKSVYPFVLLNHATGVGMAVLAGKIAVVTGGAYSLGYAFCEALAAEGADIAIADIREGADAASALREKFGHRALAFKVDVSDEGSVSRFAREVREALGTVEILVNNAALFAELPALAFHEYSTDLWD